MPNTDLLPALPTKFNENQLALGAAIEELSNWVEQRGSVEVADNIRAALWPRDNNLEFIEHESGSAQLTRVTLHSSALLNTTQNLAHTQVIWRGGML